MTIDFKDKLKSDLHNHISLGMRYEVFRKWTAKKLPNMPKNFRGISGMRGYIDSFYKPNVKNSGDAFDLIEMGIEESIRDNVVLLEASVDIGTVKFFKNVDLFLARLDETIRKFKKQIDFKPDLGIPKNIPQETIVNWGIPCIKSGIFNGIDLYGPELDDVARFSEIYSMAGDKKMIKKGHVGEFSSADSIVRMIEILGLQEIQHGIAAANSDKVMDYIRENCIQLNICPASNISLGVVSKIEEHPIRILYDRGIKVTINTDDLLFFNKSNSEQYQELFERGIFNYEEIDEIISNGLRSRG